MRKGGDPCRGVPWTGIRVAFRRGLCYNFSMDIRDMRPIEETRSLEELLQDPENAPDGGDGKNYVRLLWEWAVRKYGAAPRFCYVKAGYETVLYIPFDGINQRPDFKNMRRVQYHCIMTVGDLRAFRGFGATRGEALKAVCKFVYNDLERGKLLE